MARAALRLLQTPLTSPHTICRMPTSPRIRWCFAACLPRLLLPATSTGFGTLTAKWDFGDGSPLGTTGNTVNHTYTTSGSFPVTMTVTDGHGCSSIFTSYVTVVGYAPTFTAPAALCPNQIGFFTNTTPGAGITNWDFGDGQTDMGTSATTHSYTNAGIDTVTMTTTIGTSCVKTLKKIVTVNPSPVVSFVQSPAIPCSPPTTVTFTSTTTGAATYAWTFGRGGTATGPVASKYYTSNVEDEVTLTATSAAGCVGSLVVDTVRIRKIVVTVLPTAEAASGCIPFKPEFSAVVTGAYFPWPPAPMPIAVSGPYPAAITSWFWDFGDGTTSTLALPPPHAYPNVVGTYTVKCVVTTANGCTDSGYTSIHVDTKVPPLFSASPLTICADQPVTFVNSTGAATPLVKYGWDLGDSSTELLAKVNIVHRYHLPGQYDIKLITNHNGCLDTLNRRNYLTINPSNAEFADSVACAPSTFVKFVNKSIGATFSNWYFGDGDTSKAVSPTHTYAATGAYTVRLVTFNPVYGCSDTFSKRVDVYSSNLSFVADDITVCKDVPIRFTGAFSIPGAAYFAWKFDNYKTAANPTDSFYTYSFATSGYHTITFYAASGNGCYDSIVKSAYVLVSRPVVGFSVQPPLGCTPMAVLFTDTSKNTPFVSTALRTWDFGDGPFVNNNNTASSHTYPVAGNYSVQLKVKDSQGCEDSLRLNNAVIAHHPRALFSPDASTACAAQNIRFTSTSYGQTTLTHRWEFGDGSPAAGGYFPTHRYKSAGDYTVRLVVTDTTGCTDTAFAAIHINAPHAAFSASDHLAICPPLQVQFTNASSGAVAYQWLFGNGSGPVTIPDPLTTFKNSGLYIVKLIATDVYACTDTARDTIRVLGYNGAFTYNPTSGCVPMKVTFSVPFSAIPRITWDFSDGFTDTTSGTSVTHTYTTPGVYLPKVIFSDGKGCSAPSVGLDSIRVDKVKADFSWTTPCAEAPFTLTQTASAIYLPPNAWNWDFGDGSTATGPSVSHTYPAAGNHPVTLSVANATGCRDSVTKSIFINPTPPVRAMDDTAICPGDLAALTVSGALRYVWTPAPDSCNGGGACDTAFVRPPGAATYYVSGTDGKGCVGRDSVKIIIQIRTHFSTGEGGEICLGESFRLVASGAQSYAWTPAGTLDSPFIASPLATPIGTTIYTVTAREGSCDADVQQIRVVVRPRPLFSAGTDQIIALGSAVTLQPVKGGIDHIIWRADTTLSCLACFNPVARPYYTTVYYATGYNEWGCTATDSVTVHVRCNGSLVFIPNTFTPNGGRAQ